MSKTKLFLRMCVLGAALIAPLGCQHVSRLANTYKTHLSRHTPVDSLLEHGGMKGDPSPEQKVDVQMAMASVLERQGKTAQAIERYTDIAREHDHAVAYHRLAVLHEKSGDFEKSEQFYQAALERDPENAEVLCDIGYSYYLQRRWAESEASLRKAIKIEPRMARAHNNIGLLFARVDRHEDALRAFTAAGCDEARARVNLAFVLITDQKLVEAREQLVRALLADESLKPARNLLATLDRTRAGQQQRVAQATAPPAYSNDVQIARHEDAEYTQPQATLASVADSRQDIRFTSESNPLRRVE